MTMGPQFVYFPNQLRVVSKASIYLLLKRNKMVSHICNFFIYCLILIMTNEKIQQIDQ